MSSKNPHTIEFPPLAYNRDQAAEAHTIATEFLPKLETALAQKSTDLANVFHEESWHRDALVFSWDLRTRHGRSKIQDYLNGSSLREGFSKLKITNSFSPRFTKPVDDFEWLEFSIGFETALARCKGMVRLTQDGEGSWKVYLFYSAVDELKGHEELLGKRRPHGGRNTLAEHGGRNWIERRRHDKEYLEEDPQVLIIGAGHSGLNIGARLKTLQVSNLLIDRNKRIGDNWRLRYRTLSTHDPVHTCHMPYIPFPPTWSFFTPKDKLADFLEAYASLMELDVWLQTSLASHPTFDKAKGVWQVELKREDGSIRKLHPRHIIFCTGHSGEPKIPTFPGQDTFKGKIYHGSQHKDASELESGVQGKNVIVVGTGNSGHDIAQNFYECGANTTMLQRHHTYIITADPGIKMFVQGLYDEDSPGTDDSDVYLQAFPIPVQFRLYKHSTALIAEADKELRQGLEKAGFGLTLGIDGGGIFRNYLERGGGYYIDVGASQLIADGKIKVKQSPDGIQGFDENHLILANGEKLPAEIVVLATGYDNMRTSLRKSMGDEVADQCSDVWGLDQEGELRAMWRQSGHPNLWFMGGNLSLTRTYSKFLALQIKAVEAGLNKATATNGVTDDTRDTAV